MKWTLVAQGLDDEESLETAIKFARKDFAFDRLDVAVAYATLQGVKILELAIDAIPPESRWVIGLDDAITQPEAINYLLEKPGARVRLAKMAPSGRFHPKLYTLWSSTANERCLSALGSGNMTLNGMRSNGETAIILLAETIIEADKLRQQWDKMWSLGQDATPDEIARYREVHAIAKKQRKKISDIGVAPPEPEPDAPIEENYLFNGDPANAHLAWLEAGTPSAGGRDLEFPKKMMPFFKLTNNRESRQFIMQNNISFPLIFTRREDNQMWRLLFTSNSIQAAIGRDSLRPLSGQNRSDLAITFRRTNDNNFIVHMFQIGSVKYDEIIKKSKEKGEMYSTRGPGGRKFGFF